MTGAGDEDDMPVPVEVQHRIFVKVLEMDRALVDRAGDELVVGVVFQGRVRESYLAKDYLVQAFRRTNPIQGLEVSAVEIEASGADDLHRAILEHEVDVIYVGPVRTVDIADFAAVTRGMDVLSLTGVPRFVRQRLAVGIGLNGQKPQILVNTEAAREEGARFDARLLRLAEVVDQ